MTPRNPSNGNDETRYLGPVGGPGDFGGSGAERPRQYFPGEHDPDYRYEEPRYEAPQYQQPAYQEPHREPVKKKSGGALPMLLGILFGLTLLAAVAFFFLWRNAAAEADREPPAPVTVTSTVSQTLTETVTEEAPLLPTQIPTELPSDILPSEVPEFDVDGLLDRFFGDSEPAPAQ